MGFFGISEYGTKPTNFLMHQIKHILFAFSVLGAFFCPFFEWFANEYKNERVFDKFFDYKFVKNCNFGWTSNAVHPTKTSGKLFPFEANKGERKFRLEELLYVLIQRTSSVVGAQENR